MKTPRANRVASEIKNVLQAQPRPEALHECSLCSGELVYPVAWEQRAGERWYIERRCTGSTRGAPPAAAAPAARS